MQRQRGLYMKKYFYLVILIFLFFRCNTNPTSSLSDDHVIPVRIENLTGTWNWTQSLDSTDQVVDRATSDITRSVMITQDYTFKEFRDDTLIFNDTFRLLKTVLPNATDSLCYMDWDHSKYFNYIVYSLKSKTLVIGYSWGYKKEFSRNN